MMNEYINAVLGGLTIGISATILAVFLGRIMGVSGILYQGFINLKTTPTSEKLWRILFIAGTILGPVLLIYFFDWQAPTQSDSSLSRIIIAGLLVGIGTNLGSGCTSGHGICGISRFSLRSIIATLIFMLFGILAASLL